MFKQADIIEEWDEFYESRRIGDDVYATFKKFIDRGIDTLTLSDFNVLYKERGFLFKYLGMDKDYLTRHRKNSLIKLWIEE